jgi:hypothetical protein
MSTEVETSHNVSEIVRDSSPPLGMTKIERLRDGKTAAADLARLLNASLV